MNWLFAFLLSLFLSGSVMAQAQKVEINVDGMTCPSCAASVESQLSELESVVDVDISLSSGTAAVTLKNAKLFNPDDLKKAIKKAGFRVNSIKPEN